MGNAGSSLVLATYEKEGLDFSSSSPAGDAVLLRAPPHQTITSQIGGEKPRPLLNSLQAGAIHGCSAIDGSTGSSVCSLGWH
jgi:hypothetical protein